MKRTFFFLFWITGSIRLFSQTITTSPISGSPFCAGSTINVPFTKTGTFNTGNVFTAQLSNASGSFANPINIGSLTSVNAGTIVSTIPSNTPAGSGFRIRVVSSLPARTGTTSSSIITINTIVSPDVSIIQNSTSNNNCNSTNISFAATTINGGNSPQFAWFKNGLLVGNSNTYSSTNWNNNDSVYCVLTSNASCLTKVKDTSNKLRVNIENSDANSWKKRNDISVPLGLDGGTSFVINGKAYVCTGSESNSLWEYDPASDLWIPRSNFPGIGRSNAISFVIGEKAYVGLGTYNDFYEYNPTNDSWSPKTNFPGYGANAGFSIGTKGYVASRNNFWQYNPTSDTWSAKSNIPNPPLDSSAGEQFGFSIGNKGYIGGGYFYTYDWVGGMWGYFPVFNYSNLFFEYNPETDSWISKSNSPSAYKTTSFTIGNKAYICNSKGALGYRGDNPPFSIFYEYDQSSNKWKELSVFEGDARTGCFGFSIGSKGYIGGGRDYRDGQFFYIDTTFKQLWEYRNYLTCDSITQSYCPGQTLSVNFSTNCRTFDANNLFTLQISNGSGSFENPTVIGQLNSNVSGSITSTLPTLLPSASNYRIRVIASNPSYIGESYPITINPIVTPFSISGVQNLFNCASDSIYQFSVPPTPGANYTWAVSGINNSIINGQGTPNINVRLVSLSTISINAQVNNVCGLTSASAVQQLIRAAPLPPPTVKKSFQPDVKADLIVNNYLKYNVDRTRISDTFRIRKIPSVKTYFWEVPTESNMVQISDTCIALVFADSIRITPNEPKYVKVYAVADCSISAPTILSLIRNINPVHDARDTSICGQRTIVLSASNDTATRMTDIDGQSYPITRIGNQVWLAENYKKNFVDNYGNSYSSFYDNDSITNNKFGRLYYQNSDGSFSYSPGWHLPSLSEFNQLINFIGGVQNGGKLKSTESQYWNSPNFGASNVYGFNAKGAGYSVVDNFYGIKDETFYLTSSIFQDYDESTTPSYCIGLDNYSSMISISTRLQFYTSSIRLVRDQPALTYLWSTGATTRTISVNPLVSTIYYCTVSDGVGTYIDTIRVTVNTSVPAAPSALSITPIQTNVCGARIYRYSAPVLPAGTTTATAATGYEWSFTGTLGANATIDSGDVNSRTIVVSYTSNAAALAGDSVKVRYTSACGNSLAKAAKLSNLALATPAAPTAITITAIQANVCGNKKFRYSAPALPGATTTAGAATGYVWSFTGTLGANAVIDSGNVNSRTIVVSYTSNAAGLTGDSVKVCYTSDCGNGAAKAAKLTNVDVGVPAAPTAITITAIQTNVCGVRKYRYTAPNLPAGTTSKAPATGYVWDFVGSLAEFATIDSGDENSQKLVLIFASNAAAATGDSIRLYYTSSCGNSLRKAAKFSNLKLSPPAAPGSLTIQAIQTNVCGVRKYRYIAPALPSASTTAGAATGYEWSFVGTLSSTMTIDSGSLTSRTFTVTFTSNAASSIGDSVRVYFTSDCGNSLRKSIKLSNTLLNPPLAPASITMTLVQNDCGARIYRYTAPALPAATTVNGAATGYAWTMPFGPLGLQGTLDSGTLTGRTIRIIYPSNDASQDGDSIRVRYNSACGFGPNKTMKLSNTVKTGCPPITKPSIPIAKGTENLPKSQKLSVMLYPNPSADQFYVKLSSESKSKVMIRIFDMQGKRVQQLEALPNGVTQIGNGLKSGAYMMQVRQDGEVQTQKLVKL